ncbi:type II-A CRISPR-associated protein Csn2 [Lachnobacterium bovis]|uniref:type II-A CRISPR-associated protein Csn2 n=1 Tax=Lachnobacterium bovis TaxID=140626 RepID=UPI0004803C4B|nr:type II-A CRISPR-associated protein Csn2 [Lachnobacterium bovis]
MTLLIPKYDLRIKIQENEVNVLCIENPDAYSYIIKNLWQQVNGEDGEMILSEGEKELKISKDMELITNPFAVDCNDKKILNKVYIELAENFKENYMMEMSDINTNIVNVLDELMSDFSYPLASDIEMDPIGLFKLYRIQMDMAKEDYVSYLLEYMKLKHMICKVNVFVIVDLRSYMDDIVIEELYKNLFYEKIFLIVISGHQYENPIECEKTLILDKDLCIIKSYD